MNIIFFVILAVLLVIVVLVYVIRSVSPVTPFLYSNARIQARTPLLIDDQKLNELVNCRSLKELSSSLTDSDYSEKLDKLGKLNLRLFHLALERSFVDSLVELIKLSPDTSKPIFDAYLMFLEGKILKTIYRIKLYNLKIEQDLIFPIGNINHIVLKHLLEAATIADMQVTLNQTVYSKVFYKKYDTLEEFEIALDDFILNNFIEVTKKTKMHESKFIIDMMDTKVDLMNILSLLKFRIRNTDKEKQKKLLIKNDTPLSFKFDKLIDAEDLKDFVEVCKDLTYYAPLSKALAKYEKDKSMFHFEHELFRYYKEFVVDQDLYHTLGPYPLFSYLVKKELEQKNLFIVSSGIDSAISSDKIREMTI